MFMSSSADRTISAIEPEQQGLWQVSLRRRVSRPCIRQCGIADRLVDGGQFLLQLMPCLFNGLELRSECVVLLLQNLHIRLGLSKRPNLRGSLRGSLRG